MYKSIFTGGSVVKNLPVNAGDKGLILGLGRSPGEGIGNPLQYSWTSLVAQMMKNLPAMQETWVQSLGWEDPLEAGMATHSSILAWRISMDRGVWRATVHAVTESDTTETTHRMHNVNTHKTENSTDPLRPQKQQGRERSQETFFFKYKKH